MSWFIQNMLDFEINIIVVYIYLSKYYDFLLSQIHVSSFKNKWESWHWSIEPAIKSEKIEDNDKMILNKVLKISWLNANKAKKKKSK